MQLRLVRHRGRAYRGTQARQAAAVLDAIPGWIADYNAVAPHSALGYLAPQQYRAGRLEQV